MLYSTPFIIQAQSLRTRPGQLPLVKSVSMRKPGRRRYRSNHRFRSNLAQMLGFGEKIIKWQNREKVKIFHPFKFGELLAKMAHLALIYAYSISHLCFSISIRNCHVKMKFSGSCCTTISLKA